MNTVLLVTVDDQFRQQVNQVLPGASIFSAQDTDDALRQLGRIDINLAIWTLAGRRGDGAFLERAKDIAPTCVTLVIGARDEDASIADFGLPKAHTVRQLQTVVTLALEKHRLLRERAAHRPRAPHNPTIATGDPDTPPPHASRLLREFTRILASGFDLRRLLEIFAEAVVEFLRPARLALLLPEPDGDVYRVRAQRGLAPQISESVRLSLRRGLCHWLAVEGRPARTTDAIDADVLRELTILQGAMAVPLLAHGELVAVLVLGPPIVRSAYATEEVETLFDLATHVASAIQGISLHDRLQRVSESNERILEHMSNGLIAIGPDERVSTMNRRAGEILQLDTAATIGHDLRVLPSPLGDLLYETLMTGRARPPSEIQLALRGLWIEVSAYPVHGERTRAAVLVFDDLTAQKELAAQKLHAEQFELLTRFVARIADEIKNPLVSINTFVELIGERFDDSDFRHQFSSVVGRDVRRLAEIFEKLAGLVGQGELNFSAVEVNAIVDEAVATIKVGDGKLPQPVEIVVTRETGPLLIKVDPGQLRRALCYLMWYLVHHSPSRSSLSVAIGRHTEVSGHDDVRVVVASRTVDVQVFDIEGLFDPVRMVQESLIDIGPAVSQRIIEALGGRLTLRRGRHDVAFVIRLPVAI